MKLSSGNGAKVTMGWARRAWEWPNQRITKSVKGDAYPMTRWQKVRIGLGLVVAWVALFGRDVLDGWPSAVCTAACGIYIGRGLMMTPRVKSAYQGGYLRGRLSWWESMKEAQDRGIPPWDWIRAEFERDFHDILQDGPEAK